jgi:DNA-binding XRE family transcriptional regulator
MEYEKNKDIQLLTLSGTEYVLVRRKKYDELLDKLEAIDTALDIARSRTDASEDLLQAMLKGDFSVEQIRNVSTLRQRDLSEKTGVSQATISNLENNRISEPSFQALDAIFQGLDVPGGAVYPLLKSLKSSS